MSAATICGSKRYYDFFGDLPSSPPVSKKKLHCSSSSSPSPIRFSPSSNGLLDHLNSLFPSVNPQLLETALEESDNDIESTIQKVRELSSTSSEEAGAEYEQKGALPGNGDFATDFGNKASSNQIVDCAQWVDLFVSEMLSATSVEDARSRATKLLESLEKSFLIQVVEEAVQGVQKC